MRNSALKQRILELQIAWTYAVIELAANEDSEYARERADMMKATCKHLCTLCGYNINEDEYED